MRKQGCLRQSTRDANVTRMDVYISVKYAVYGSANAVGKLRIRMSTPLEACHCPAHMVNCLEVPLPLFIPYNMMNSLGFCLNVSTHMGNCCSEVPFPLFIPYNIKNSLDFCLKVLAYRRAKGGAQLALDSMSGRLIQHPCPRRAFATSASGQG